jgi:hypothetical protein
MWDATSAFKRPMIAFPLFITRSCMTMTMNKKHVLIMLACCLIPLVALAAIFVFKIPVTSVVYVGILLLCPALHLLMMRNMLGHHADHGASGDHTGHGARVHGPTVNVQPPQLPAGEKQD